MFEARFLCLTCLISFTCFIFVKCRMEPFIVGGNFAKISRFPHSVFMRISCVNEKGLTMSWICGGSIVSQAITLTAAHCLFGCGLGSNISMAVGNSHRNQGVHSIGKSFIIHEDYDAVKLSCDIALVSVKPTIKFNSNAKKVVLMKKPPYYEKAQIAGWGLINETKALTTDLLKFVDQYVWSVDNCRKYMRTLPKGTICASSKNREDYSAQIVYDISRSSRRLDRRSRCF